MADTKIEWTQQVWNPVTGCRPYSSGCANCYAQVQSHIRGANRHPAMVRKYHGLTVLNSHGRPTFTGEVRCHEEDLLAPLKVKKPTTWFVNSMSDLFYGDEKDRKAAESATSSQRFTPVPFQFIDKVFAVMALCPQHTFQILTKRAGRMAEYLSTKDSPLDKDRWDIVAEWAVRIGKIVWDARGSKIENYYGSGGWKHGEDISNRRVPPGWPLPNVWLGVSVEDQRAADERIPHLLKVPAAVRFLSCEPLLGPVNLKLHSVLFGNKGGVGSINGEVVRFPGFDWVIAGGESGHGARPAHPDWFRSLRDQCQAAEVPFFFKQFGDYGTISSDMSTGAPVFRMFDDKRHWINKARTWVNGGTCVDRCGRVLKIGADFDSAAYPVAIVHRVGKKKAGRLLDGREWNEMPAQRAASRLAGNTDGDLDD